MPLSQHTHTPYATALGCLENPRLEMVHQNSCRFLGRCAWDTGYQPATMIEEGERLGQVLGDKDILFMCHHGTLVSQSDTESLRVNIILCFRLLLPGQRLIICYLLYNHF